MAENVFHKDPGGNRPPGVLTPLERKKLELFLSCWHITTFAERAELTFDEACDFLLREDVQKAIDLRNEKLQTIYSRMPKQHGLEVMMGRLASIGAGTSATEIRTLFDTFMHWWREAPPPSNREFAESLMKQLASGEDK